MSSAYRRGMTLIELAVALALVAVIAMYALPTYREPMRRSMRIAAVSAVYRAAHYVEMQLAQCSPVTIGDALTLPAGLDHAPQGWRAAYAIRVTGATTSNGGYSVMAQPLQDGPMADDKLCGAFKLDATGWRSNSAVASDTSGGFLGSAEHDASSGVQWREQTRCWTQ